jgi:hypothetical protein
MRRRSVRPGSTASSQFRAPGGVFLRWARDSPCHRRSSAPRRCSRSRVCTWGASPGCTTKRAVARPGCRSVEAARQYPSTIGSAWLIPTASPPRTSVSPCAMWAQPAAQSTCHQSGLGADCRYYPIRELCPADLACTDYVDGGTCVPARAQGERCFITNDCQPGLFCDGTTCAPLRSVGEPCTMNLGNPSVPTQSGYVFCAAGLYCELANGPPGICTPLKRAGETCRWDFYCAFGLKCLGDGTGKDVCTRPHCADPTP